MSRSRATTSLSQSERSMETEESYDDEEEESRGSSASESYSDGQEQQQQQQHLRRGAYTSSSGSSGIVLVSESTTTSGEGVGTATSDDAQLGGSATRSSDYYTYDTGEFRSIDEEGNTMSTDERTSDYSIASQSTQPTSSPSAAMKRKKAANASNRTAPDPHDAQKKSPSSSSSNPPPSSITTATKDGGIRSANSATPISAGPRSPDRKRVPGGAAAKIMLIGPKESSEVSEVGTVVDMVESSESNKVNAEAVDISLEHDLRTAKEEFCKGSPSRIKLPGAADSQPDGVSDNVSDVNTQLTASSTTPSFLNRTEVFHRTAKAAVEALLTPPTPMRSQSPSGRSSIFSDSSSAAAAAAAATSPRSPKSPDSGGAMMQHETRSIVSESLIDSKTERKVEEMQFKMLTPTSTLTSLLTAIATPEEEIADMLGYMVRRKNACGALQTLTANPANRVRICWTVGVLSALTSVLKDGLLNDDMPDGRIRTEYSSARNRAIAALMNLSMPVKNRIPVFHSPGLVQAVLATIVQDDGAARRGCTAVLGFLAKSPENRLLLAQVPGLLNTACQVLQPRPPRVEPVETVKKKKVYPWSDDEDDSSSSSSSTGGRNSKGSQHKNKNEASFTSTFSSNNLDDSGAPAPLEMTLSAGYDETADDLLKAARQNCFAMLGHLVKEKDNAYHLARDTTLVTTLVTISRFQSSPSHVFAVKILAHLTRHRLNKVLAFKPKSVVPALVEATQSPSDDARLYACYALQNLSQEKSCRQELAIAEHLIEALCDQCRNATQADERLAAISTLKNLCDEPANLIPMTNTTGCVSTLMYFAHTAGREKSDVVVTELMQYRACDALATLSHWLRKIATSGLSLDAAQKGQSVASKGLFVPSLREVSWNQWT